MCAPIGFRPEPAFGPFDITPDSQSVRSEKLIQLELYARTFGIQAPPVKFVVPGDDRVYLIPSEDLKTYEHRTQDMKIAVADKLQIDLDAVLDMNDDPIQRGEWNLISNRWPYCFGKFTVIGQPRFSDPVLTVVWKSQRLAIKLWLPRPRRITVGELLTIVRIENCCPRDLVDFVRKKGCAECLQQPTVFVGIVETNGSVTHSHSAERTEPQMVFVAVQNLWVMLPYTEEPRPDLLVPASLTVSEVKAIIEQEFWETMGLEEEEDRAGVIVQHKMVSAAPEGSWEEIADQRSTALGTMRMGVRSVLWYDE
ncbi:hypothetical protein FN846DRAFT_896310 [Sphaerosporella brunnea]|uniref:Uncharacterized protein n=1 Tax=Sphaerosporella brunnea TaxID=1250544 RepID=A0A5J5ECU8_9PEZI|nr:hypothetical protein FN846DRAFT_896310 [Sphaerosporella brunnea]